MKEKKPARPRRAKSIAVTLLAERIGDKFKVTATHEGEPVHVDMVNLDSANHRQRFIKAVGERLVGVDVANLDRTLMALPATVPVEPESVVDAEPESAPVQVTVSITYADGTARADHEGATVHLDKLDCRNAQHRARFIKAIAEKLPNLDVADTDAQLLSIAEQLIVEQAKPAPAGDEVDVLNVVRPELFHTAEVSGVAVPVTMLVNGKPSAQWRLYLQWRDGRRECRPLAASLDVPGGRRLWVHPVPGEPAMNTAAGWTASARRHWLDSSESQDAATLFREVCETIAYYVDFPADTAAGTTATVALWIILSYCYPLFPAVPYLSVGGPMGSGKSRLLDVSARLVFRPLNSSNLTGAALFRTLHDRGGVLVYDEAERLRQSTPDVAELLSMLLAGYRRGGSATRLEAVGDSFKTVSFDVYGPKAIAGIAGLPPTLASRAISITMFRAAGDSPRTRRRLDDDDSLAAWEHLRAGLHALALDAGTAWLGLPKRAEVVPVEIGGRDYELWQPLLALAAWIESCGAHGLLSLMQKHAIASVKVSKDDSVPEADETLLELLADSVRRDERPSPAALLQRAQERDTSTFAKWGPRTISNRLAVYGVRAEKVNGRREFRVTMTELLKIQSHYGIDLQVPAAPTSNPSTLSSLSSLLDENHLFSGDNSGTKQPGRDARDARDEANEVGG